MPFDFPTLLNVLISGLMTGLVYGLMALGLSVIFGVARVVNFAHGEMMALAMYAAALLFSKFRVNPLMAVVPVGAAFFFFGYGLQRLVLRPFVIRPQHSQFLLLLALAVVITSILLIVFGPDARAVNLDWLLEPVVIGDLLLDQGKLYAAVVACAVAAALFAFFRLSYTGTAIRACADNSLGAKIVGLDVDRLYAIAFGIGASCVGVAGCMMILLVDVTPGSGPTYTLLAFVIVIVGGLGSMSGALIGGVLIGISEAFGGLFIAPSAKSMISFALMIIVLIFRPRGLIADKL
jgi:branched-chain amino acid transport system permease protein